MLQSSTSSADVSSWLSAGGGYGLARNETTSTMDRATLMSFAVGVGSTPRGSIVVGGLVRSTTYFTLGTDLGLAARVATGGFARGQWGGALDLGPTWRTWSSGDYGRFPVGGRLVVGAPWGLELGIAAEAFDLRGGSSTSLSAVLAVDLLRLTVMRQGATDHWWENPSPAGGRIRD